MYIPSYKFTHYFDVISGCEWRWDTDVYPSTSLKHEDREVLFHPDYSCGTAAARGDTPLESCGEHFWEVKMTSAVYGTDMVNYLLQLD